MEAILKINNLTKYFGKKKILDNVSIELFPGEVFGFLGPNGAGKTTTIKIVMGFLRADSGEISINGLSLKKNYEDAMSNLGGIVENPEMYKDLSGKTNLQMYARLHKGVTKERIDEVVSLVGMQNRINTKVKKYSLGMKQRVGLAQAILHRPKVLILDEPTNGLDPAGIRELRDIVTKLAHEENVAVLVSSHLLSEMQLMCDRVAIIDKGRVLGVKPIKELLDQAMGEVSFKFFTKQADVAYEILKEKYSDKIKDVNINFIQLEIPEDEVPQVNMLLASNMVAIMEIKKTEISLEQAFMNMTGGGVEIE